MYSAGGMEEKSKAGAKVGGTGTKPPFTGVCKKDLAGATIVHSSDVQDMSRQYRAFYDRVVVAAGKVGSALVTAIKRKKILTLAHFKPIKPDPGEWTNKGVVDDDMKGLYSEGYKMNLQSAVRSYTSFKEDWTRMYYRIVGQVCPETMQQMIRSTKWKTIKEQTDPGGLMALLQDICLSGNDNAYYPEKLLNSFKELLNRPQDNSSPSQFSAQTGSNDEVVHDIAMVGEDDTFWGYIPGLQMFVIDKFEEFSFEHDELGYQDDYMQRLVSEKCRDVMLACIMTVNSNPLKSNMNTEVHKNMLANHPNAFASDRSKAVDQLVGYEEMKSADDRRERAKNVLAASTKDTAGNIVLVTAGEEGTDDRHDGSCWICGKMGHRQYKCPSLSQEERTDIRKMTMNEVAVFFEKKQKKYRAKKGGDDNNIEAAVHVVLGQYVDGTEDKKDKVFDDTDSDEDDDSTESYLNTFSFCQISVGNPGVNNDMESSGIPGVQRLWDHEESGEIPGVQGLCEDGSVTSKDNG